jgi:hypothetical protein
MLLSSPDPFERFEAFAPTFSFYRPAKISRFGKTKLVPQLATAVVNV